MQPRYNNEVQGNWKRADLYGLVKLMFDLAYSRCCFAGGSDNRFGFNLLNLFVPIPCATFLLIQVQLQISRALSLSILFSTL